MFKAACLLVYLFGSLLWRNQVLTYIACIILLAVDFWTVKNVTGRLLVGLRWWQITRTENALVANAGDTTAVEQETEKTEWVFESLQDEGALDPMDKSIFWMGMYVWPLIWSVFLLSNVLSLRLNWSVFLII